MNAALLAASVLALADDELAKRLELPFKNLLVLTRALVLGTLACVIFTRRELAKVVA